jgi:hypothetical protein
MLAAVLDEGGPAHKRGAHLIDGRQMGGPVVGDEVKSQGGAQIQGCPDFFGFDSTPPQLVAFQESDPVGLHGAHVS